MPTTIINNENIAMIHRSPARSPLRHVLSGILATTGMLLSFCTLADNPPSADDPQFALVALAHEIIAVDKELRASPSFGTDQERALAYMHMTRTLISAMESSVLQDPDYPYLKVLDFWLREGGDNSDQRYTFARVRGGEAYRIWGNQGSALRIEVQLYSGAPWENTGRTTGFLAFEEMAINPDGSFEIEIGGDAGSGNWLENASDTTTVMIRQIYNEWDSRNPGHVHLDRVGFEGKRLPPPTQAEVAEKLRNATEQFRKLALGWPKLLDEKFVTPEQTNQLSQLFDGSSWGGVKGRWSAMSHYNLPVGKALVIKSWPTSATYQGIQLTDMWFASLEYGNQVSSLNAAQSQLAPDGAYYHVIAQQDPGYINWLDTGGLARGAIIVRYDGATKPIEKNLHPQAELVDIDQLESYIPGFKTVSSTEREQVRAERRKHLQIRANR